MTSRRRVPPMIDAGRLLGGPLIINKIGTGRFDGYLHRIAATTEKSVTPTVATEIIPTLEVGSDARYDDYQDYFCAGGLIGPIAAQFSLAGIRAITGRAIIDRIYCSATATGLTGVLLGWGTDAAGGVVVSPTRANAVGPATNLTVDGVKFSTLTHAAPAQTTLLTVHIPGQSCVILEGPFVLDSQLPNFWLTVQGLVVNMAMRVAFQGRFDAGFRRQMTS